MATIAQMIMGLILPFVLAFAIIPLESFIHSSRAVMGYVSEFVLRVIAFVLRLVGNAFYYLGSILISVYDIIAFPAMLMDTMTGSGKKKAPKVKKPKFKKQEREEMLGLEE